MSNLHSKSKLKVQSAIAAAKQRSWAPMRPKSLNSPNGVLPSRGPLDFGRPPSWWRQSLLDVRMSRARRVAEVKRVILPSHPYLRPPPMVVTHELSAVEHDVHTRRALGELSLLVAKSKRVVVVTGAGISCSSGIPDFRSSDGLYNLVKQRYPDVVMKGRDLFDASLFRDATSTALFYSFIAELKLAIDRAQPGPTHRFLKTLHHKNKLLRRSARALSAHCVAAADRPVVQLHPEHRRLRGARGPALQLVAGRASRGQEQKQAQAQGRQERAAARRHPPRPLHRLRGRLPLLTGLPRRPARRQRAGVPGMLDTMCVSLPDAAAVTPLMPSPVQPRIASLAPRVRFASARCAPPSCSTTSRTRTATRSARCARATWAASPTC